MYFKDIFYSAGLGQLKNSMEFFKRIDAALGIGCGERPVLFEDDANVVRLARECGWDACVFDTVQDVLTHPRLQPLLQVE